ncbi:MAG: DNA-processing protein DprA [Betaproteobacteria bacterium]
MQPDERLRAWVHIAAADGLGSRGVAALLGAFGSPEGVLAASTTALERLVSPGAARALRTPAAPEALGQVLEWAAVPGNHLLTWDDPDYPRSLLEIGDAPVLLYYKGRRELLNVGAVAVVGSRNASPAGIRTAESFAEALAAAGLTIVSGLALGIDAAAHRGGLQAGASGGSTIAVIGTGIDRIYPPRHRDLAHRIAAEGGILSEFQLSTPPLAANFPRRNRLISGLARGVLVVEATLGSGSLITARFAGEQGREVLAIPGSIHSPFSKGCHKLIKDGAKLVETAQDVLEELKWSPSGSVATLVNGAQKIDGDPQILLDALGFELATVDELCARMGWAADRVSTVLLQLELAGAVAQTHGGRIQRLG